MLCGQRIRKCTKNEESDLVNEYNKCYQKDLHIKIIVQSELPTFSLISFLKPRMFQGLFQANPIIRIRVKQPVYQIFGLIRNPLPFHPLVVYHPIQSLLKHLLDTMSIERNVAR